MRAICSRYLLRFKEPSGTSRGMLMEKETYFIQIWEEAHPQVFGVGECALFRGLSAEDCLEYEAKLQEVCENITGVETMDLSAWSSIRFGVEMALADLRNGGKGLYFPSTFTTGVTWININGLIWMGNRATMLQRIEQKLEEGFRCIKLKIGAIDFDAELSLLACIREAFNSREVELRVDANGAFTAENALKRLDALAVYDLHSVEQPIRQGQWEEMARLCCQTPLPIALDEELIGVEGEQKQALLNSVQPQYIVLKPALCGGFSGAEDWIRLAEESRIKWWVTSALESNIGLDALSQWVATLYTTIPQGLGTGQLYTNNFVSPLRLEGERLNYNPLVTRECPNIIGR